MMTCRPCAFAAVASSVIVAGPMAPAANPCSLSVIRQQAYDSRVELGAPSVSADGRFVAFASRARLVPSATGTQADVYVLDLQTHTLTMESPLGDVAGRHVDSRAPSISGDGRFVAFERSGAPDASNPVGYPQIMLRDRRQRTTRMLSVNAKGMPGDRASGNPVVSADGRVVAFESSATNLIAGGDSNRHVTDVYVAVPETGAIVRASLDREGRQREDPSFSPAISADGRYVAFTSDARLDEDPAPGRGLTRRRDVFVRDLARGTTDRVSRRRDGREPNGASYSPSINGDGRWVAFVSNATDIVPGVKKGVSNIYLYDLETSTTTLVSRAIDGAASDGASEWPVVSGNGRFVAFESDASNLVCGRRCRAPGADINLLPDVFVFDREQRSIVRLSADSKSGWAEPSGSAALDAAGRVVVFSSRHPIGDNDTGNDYDLFVATRCGEPSRNSGAR